MQIGQNDELIKTLESSWAKWVEKESNDTNWDDFKNILASTIGCSPKHIVVKVVRKGNISVRLNEALLTKGVIYPVLLCDSSVDIESKQLSNRARTQIDEGSCEAVLVFAEDLSQGIGKFRPAHLTALQNSPIVEKMFFRWPDLNLDVVPNGMSIREALKNVANLQDSYTHVSSHPLMVSRADYLNKAAISLEARLNRNPTKKPIRVNANPGEGKFS
jgi:hypothetical protein